jgi:hypothetical protein
MNLLVNTLFAWETPKPVENNSLVERMNPATMES